MLGLLSILELGMLRLREVKQLAPSLTAREVKQDLDNSLLTSPYSPTLSASRLAHRTDRAILDPPLGSSTAPTTGERWRRPVGRGGVGRGAVWG